jgi:two-component system, OmpR family, response regulator MprA
MHEQLVRPTVIRSRRVMGGQRKTRAHILVIEDDPTLRQVIRELLEFEGFEVATAADDVSSRACVERERFDVIITDLFVPSTKEALSRVRLLKESVGATPVVVMTGTWLGRELTPEQLGVSEVFFKPFDIDPFLDCVRALLRRAESGGGC